eukprot:scaffold169914_cov17-Tisochrysis_lutea.AAC.1
MVLQETDKHKLQHLPFYQPYPKNLHKRGLPYGHLDSVGGEGTTTTVGLLSGAGAGAAATCIKCYKRDRLLPIDLSMTFCAIGSACT